MNLFGLSFLLSTNPSCQHCVKNPIKAEEFYSFLKKINYKVPNPQFFKVHLGHYELFIEVCQLLNESQVYGKKGLSYKPENKLGSCLAQYAQVTFSILQVKNNITIQFFTMIKNQMKQSKKPEEIINIIISKRPYWKL